MTREEQLKNEYEQKLAALKAEQDNCSHEWENVEYDPEIKREPDGFETVHQGSDCWERPTSWRTVKYDRWSRTCKTCGKVEYTKKQVPVKFEPQF